MRKNPKEQSERIKARFCERIGRFLLFAANNFRLGTKRHEFSKGYPRRKQAITLKTQFKKLGSHAGEPGNPDGVQ